MTFELGFTRNMTAIGHFGTGDVELRLHTKEDFQKAQTLIERAYEEN